MINADNIGGSSESDSEEGSHADYPQPVHCGSCLAVGFQIFTTVSAVVDRLDDSAVLRGVDAKQLRDATSAAITNVWKEATLQTTALARKISEGQRAVASGGSYGTVSMLQ
ncbi:hypothetical protein V3C99_015798 [Haemonchus contortus]